MSHFGSEELVDSIQHGFAIDDDTGFSSKVLGNVIRRCKPGGLPLSFAAQTDSSDSDNSPPFQIRNSNIPSTSVLCQQNIAKKVKDVQNLMSSRKQKPKVDQQQIERYFVQREIAIEGPQNSLLSKQIEENLADLTESRFNEFAKFEAFESEPNSRLIHIIFPFADHPTNLPPPSLPVRAKNMATIEELIGLCCCLYTRSNFTPKCSDPWRYSLYMADDSYDFDTELPSIDRNRSVGECGFPTLALVENKEDKLSNPNKHIVTVYTVSNQKFVFELDSLNESLEWLRDEALKRRQEELKTQKNLNMRQTTYQLEPVDSSQTLKLTNTISSTGLLEFLLIRKNSSRSSFNPSLFNDFLTESNPRTPLFVQTRQRPSDLRPPLSSSSSSKHLDNVDSPTTSIRSGLHSGSTQVGYGNLFQEYIVERVHRLKPRYSAKLVIRDDGIEITPVHVENRRTFLPRTSHNYNSVNWDLVGGIDSDRHGSKRISRIWWLALTPEIFELQESYQKYVSRAQKRMNENFYSDTPSQSSEISMSHPINTEIGTSPYSPSKLTVHSARPSINDDGASWSNDLNPTKALLKAYEGLNWKIIQIDASEDDAWQINMKIIEIIESKKSIVFQIFQNSSGGSKKPKTAAESTFKGISASCFQNGSKKVNRSSNSFVNSRQNKRRSINPIPYLNRMLSKPE